MAALERKLKKRIKKDINSDEPGFFKSGEALDPDGKKHDMSIRLLYCAGFGFRIEAKAIIEIHPDALRFHGNLTDISQKTYQDISAFEYAVKVKDAYFVNNVIDFIEDYEGDDKVTLAEELLQQFDKYFNAEQMAAVAEFVNAANNWCNTYEHQTWEQSEERLIQDVGKAQARFPAHIFQEYCHPKRSFYPTPQFNESELPENLSFFNWESASDDSLLTFLPGERFVLFRGGWDLACGRERSSERGRAAASWLLQTDCAAVVALDKARTEELLLYRQRLVSIVTPVLAPL